METFGEKISASTGSGKEIAGLLKKKPEDEEYDDDDTKIQKSGMSEVSRGELKVHMRCFGTCIGRYGPVDYC